MKNCLCFILLIIVGVANAQDPQFSHAYAIPLQLGPSFAGSTGASRAAINTRDQWSTIPKEYVTYSLMLDHYLYGTRNGIGLNLMRDVAGDGKLNTSMLQLQYAYSLNLTKKIALRMGLQGSYNQRKIDYTKIVFGDQLEFESNRTYTVEPSLQSKVSYFDYGASVLGIYNNFWGGFTLDHLTKPNQSLNSNISVIPKKISFYSGYKFSFKTMSNKKRRRENMYLMFNYVKQDEFNQSIFGTYWEHNAMIMGMWYRGIPFLKTYDNHINTDAYIILLGVKKQNVTFLYSYDVTLSKLMSQSGGSHEITVSIVWKSVNAEKHAKKQMHVVPCPMSDHKQQYHKQQSISM